MSEEHTCYHSDHAISRCMIHGVYVKPFNVACYGLRLAGDLTVGMCMGVGYCDPLLQLTCHRWMANATDTKVGMFVGFVLFVFNGLILSQLLPTYLTN